MKPAPQAEEALFQADARLTGAERAAFLNGACHSDAALRQRLEALLTAHEGPAGHVAAELAATVRSSQGDRRDEFHESHPKDQGLTDLVLPIEEAVGATLGPYKLREKVGEGGCGTVYVADQEKPVRRRVALKVTDSVTRLFRIVPLCVLRSL